MLRNIMVLGLTGIALLTLNATSATAQTGVATAELKNAEGKVVGLAQLAQVADGVQVTAQFNGLPPGEHGIHIHETGKCDPPAFTTAGGHFNPTKKKHGLKNPEGAHAGDLPNLKVASDGTGSIHEVARGATLDSGPTSLTDADGSALVVHAKADDDMSDPAGNSGDRIACGVIQATPAASIQKMPETGGISLTALSALLGLASASSGMLLWKRSRRS